jgi:mannose-6-phosphate isomerase
MKSMKETIFKNIKNNLQAEGFTIASYDDNRPWGGFFVIDESQAQEFANQYFEGLNVSTLKISGKLSPKILIVAPEQRLSWQYHHRRAEIWRLIDGEAGIIRSQDDTEGKLEIFKKGDTITLKQGERHRLVGLQDWAIIAEIWQHTNVNEPSDEDDIVRVQDDFGR